MPDFIPEENKIRTIKLAPPPASLPIYGKASPEEVSFIGRTNYVAALEEKKFIFGIKRRDRRRHVYVVGKSGVGKSKLIELLIRQDIAQGYGTCLIDPNGDLIESLLDFIPEARIEDVALLDPSGNSFPAWNPLANIDQEFRHQFVKGLIEIASAQMGNNWTPSVEHLFRFTILALLDYPGATLRDAIPLLRDKSVREKILSLVKDDSVKQFWEKEFDEWSKKETVEVEVITPLVNKFEQYLFDPVLGKVLSQKENKVDFLKLLESESIILINLAKGKLGKENAGFLGALFVLKIKQAAMERAKRVKIPKDFYLYIDEFHDFVTETLEHMMSEARKYHVCLTLSHQYLGQIIPHFRAAIFANVGTIIVFRIGGEDAAQLEGEMAPIFKVRDMINLGSREFYIKMVIDGEVDDPFSAETLKILPSDHKSYRMQITESSARKYGVGS